MAAVQALLERHLVHPDWAEAVAVCAVAAAHPHLFYRLHLRIEHLEMELGISPGD